MKNTGKRVSGDPRINAVQKTMSKFNLLTPSAKLMVNDFKKHGIYHKTDFDSKMISFLSFVQNILDHDNAWFYPNIGQMVHKIDFDSFLAYYDILYS
jgi:hypothetical protein